MADGIEDCTRLSATPMTLSRPIRSMARDTTCVGVTPARAIMTMPSTWRASGRALSVDTAGDGIATNFKVVATLDTLATHPGAGTVNILYEDTTLVHHTTTI